MENKLEKFGEDFISSVRDNTLFVLEGIVSGHMKSAIDVEMHKRLQQMPADQIETAKQIGYRMVDLTMHNVLSFFEHSQKWVVEELGSSKTNLQDLSDGLAGELYTSDGWIRRFSKYKSSEGL